MLEIVEENDMKIDSSLSPGCRIEIVPAADVKMCQRAKLGMTDNCAICQVLQKHLFESCKNRWW